MNKRKVIFVIAFAPLVVGLLSLLVSQILSLATGCNFFAVIESSTACITSHNLDGVWSILFMGTLGLLVAIPWALAVLVVVSVLVLRSKHAGSVPSVETVIPQNNAKRMEAAPQALIEKNERWRRATLFLFFLSSPILLGIIFIALFFMGFPKSHRSGLLEIVWPFLFLIAPWIVVFTLYIKKYYRLAFVALLCLSLGCLVLVSAFWETWGPSGLKL